jgi:putative methionine-R-sulfoxide reductase with GAF domain
VVAGDVRSEPDYRDKAPELKVRSALVVPVFVEGSAWGVIDVESERLDAFGAEDARVVRAVAAQVGSALARLGSERAGDRITAT